ncbi:MAG: hypothetical protein J5845_02835 [Lachnospiraceae bacterium]|nr:hypothetical protein [Lachnospiraceae bacterium]
MTERLYESNAYDVSFDARVTDVREGDGVFYVTLDRTLFFPEEGGQSCDRGTLAGFPVTDVQMKDGEIVHTVSGNILPGSDVHGEIDWEYRFRNMQMHSGEHVFSGLVFKYFGYANVGFHLSENSATMDYNGKLTADDVAMLEERANRVITEGHAIRAWYPSKEELASLSYRSKKEIDGAVRLVEIEGTDLCACCVPHLRNTSEIGFLKIISLENYKGGVRLQYRCGLRALDHYRDCLSLLNAAGRLLSAKQEDIPSAIERLQEEAKDLAFRLGNAVRTEIAEKIRKQYEADSASGSFSGNALFVFNADPGLLRYAMDEARKNYSGIVVILIPQDGGRFRYLMEGSERTAELQSGLRERFGAKGGGANGSVSGSVEASEEQLRAFFSERGIG